MFYSLVIIIDIRLVLRTVDFGLSVYFYFLIASMYRTPNGRNMLIRRSPWLDRNITYKLPHKQQRIHIFSSSLACSNLSASLPKRL